MDTQRVSHPVQASNAIILAEVLSPLHTTIVSPVVDGTKQTRDKLIWCNYGLKLYPMHRFMTGIENSLVFIWFT